MKRRMRLQKAVVVVVMLMIVVIVKVIVKVMEAIVIDNETIEWGAIDGE
jgi:hypothetical protein